eukprot:12800906-Alexandrium_andersonii.AAC.1
MDVELVTVHSMWCDALNSCSNISGEMRSDLGCGPKRDTRMCNVVGCSVVANRVVLRVAVVLS